MCYTNHKARARGTSTARFLYPFFVSSLSLPPSNATRWRKKKGKDQNALQKNIAETSPLLRIGPPREVLKVGVALEEAGNLPQVKGVETVRGGGQKQPECSSALF